jgi:ACS family tartrate transporter-like MFS transporter
MDRPHRDHLGADRQREKRAWLEATLERECTAVEAVRSRLTVWRGLIDPRVLLLLCCADFAFGTTSYSLGYFLPLIVKGWGLRNFLVGWTIAIPEVFGIVAMVIGSYAADRIQDKRWTLVGLIGLCTVGFVGMGLYATTAWALIAVAWIEIGIGVCSADVLDSAADVSQPRRIGGGDRPDQLFSRIFGGIVGWLKTTTDSFSGGLYYVASCTLLAAFIFVAMRFRLLAAVAPAPGE